MDSFHSLLLLLLDSHFQHDLSFFLQQKKIKNIDNKNIDNKNIDNENIDNKKINKILEIQK